MRYNTAAVKRKLRSSGIKFDDQKVSLKGVSDRRSGTAYMAQEKMDNLPKILAAYARRHKGKHYV